MREMEDSQTTTSGSQELQALDLYKQQLAQIQNALLAASDDQKADLQQLEKDLREIIELTESSLLVNPSASVDSNEQGETCLTDAPVNEDLKSLEGTKCRAPFSHEWGGLGYHNAVVLEARIVQEDEPDTETKILVKVAFVNPIHNKMKPCPYYLEGSCKFSDEKCRFSHGCEVPLDSLLDYRETDFALIKKGTAVLGKHHDDGLWYKARVEELLDDNKLSLTYEGFRDVHTVEIQDVIINEDADVAGTSSDSEDDSQADFYPRILETYSSLSDDSSQPGLGDWQKHTKGIGLKLLSKMGYVEGKGLGKQGEGRLNPVEAIVFPPGRSLDHCMELREKADNPDLFKVEKRLERQKLKEEKKLKQMADAAEKQNKISVFDFLNVKLSRESTAPEKEKPSVREQSNLKDVSSKGLNVQSFRISEDIKKTEREISKLRESIERQSGRGDVATAASIRQRLDAKEKELLRLQSSERSISKEQKQRKSTSKLTIF